VGYGKLVRQKQLRKALLQLLLLAHIDYDYVAIGKARAACAQSFTLWQQATIEIMRRNLSYCCLFALRIYIVVLRAHPVHGESHIQRNATGEVAIITEGQIQVCIRLKAEEG